ncbi:PREDICTED: bromodomain-containing protein 8-like [Sturnus vulgaris]|uniref:bromodomain-containing protein 8-like n=1 Tax=Sturnus vulgaris TaxID=9172 RepID=UPI00071A7695|nr:PREDICTED: bromodomain-containing protein 8-like [Sturnus vulgaris]
MGRACKSELESPIKSEDSDFQSIPDWDSSSDVDVRSWRTTEEVTQMLESFCISSTESSQTLWDYCGSEKQSDEEEVGCQEKTTGTGVSGAEESQLHILAQDEKEHFLGREGKSQELPGEPPLDELHPPEMSAQALDQGDNDGTSASAVLDSTGSPNMNLLQPSWNNPLQHLILKKKLMSVWRMIASHRFSSPFLKPVSEKQAPGYKDVVKSTAIFAGGTIRSSGDLIDTYFSNFSFSTKTWTDFLKTNYCLPSLELSIPFFPEVTANDLPS